MLLNNVIVLMESLLNKDLQEVINLLKNKNRVKYKKVPWATYVVSFHDFISSI